MNALFYLTGSTLELYFFNFAATDLAFSNQMTSRAKQTIHLIGIRNILFLIEFAPVQISANLVLKFI